MKTDEPIVTLVHVSDFHLNHPLTEAGRRLKRSLGTKTHSYPLLSAAAEAVNRVWVESWATKKILAATGDLTTVGHSLAFGLARQVLERTSVEDGGKAYSVGLNPGVDFWMVPGNHDRFSGSYIARQESVFESEFKSHLPISNWRMYGLNPPTMDAGAYPRLPYVKVSKVQPNDHHAGFAVIALGIDSTELMGMERADPVGRIAQGRVADSSLAYIKQVCADIRSHSRVTASDGAMHDLMGFTIRIVLLLHHHPHLPPDQQFSRLTRLMNAQEVLDCCAQNGIDMLLFGHEHISFVDSVSLGSASLTPHRVLCCAAGSMSQFDEPKGNSFNVYRFTVDSVAYESWRYDRGLFRRFSAPTDRFFL